MIKELLEASGGTLLVPLAMVVAGASLAKGWFGLYRSRSQDRRDFLDLFRGWESRDDLWLTVAVRHVFGAYLPPALIRRLMECPHPGRALLEVASAWDMLDWDAETSRVTWRIELLDNRRWRRAAKWSGWVLYVLCMGVASLLGTNAYKGSWPFVPTWLIWLYAGFAVVMAYQSVKFGASIRHAHKAMERWLARGSEAIGEGSAADARTCAPQHLRDEPLTVSPAEVV